MILFKDALLKFLMNLKIGMLIQLVMKIEERFIINHINHKELGFLNHKKVLNF